MRFDKTWYQVRLFLWQLFTTDMLTTYCSQRNDPVLLKNLYTLTGFEAKK